MNIILGSQSPRRKELLQCLFGENQVEIVPPLCADEPGFDGLTVCDAIETRLMEIVQLKLDDVAQQTGSGDTPILCADTVVVVQKHERADDGEDFRVLGKPPTDGWKPVVRDWFRTYYSGMTHQVWTGFQVRSRFGVTSQIVKTTVTMPELSEQQIDWYLSTEESVGKAGGYGIQGNAAAFINRIDGSLTNVIGLPLLEVSIVLQRIGVSGVSGVSR